jgi:hypothetical protein
MRRRREEGRKRRGGGEVKREGRREIRQAVLGIYILARLPPAHHYARAPAVFA